MVQVGLTLIVPAVPLINDEVHACAPGVTLIVGGKYIFM